MKPFLLMLLLIVTGAAQAGDHEPRWRPLADRQAARDEREHDQNGFAERRERLRALREEMLRNQLRSQPYRDENAHRISPDRGDDARPPLPPSREAEGFRRLSPEERREFRRQIHEAGRDVYHR